jgi:GNAT superfamily N-acetyltransferase
MEIKALKIRPIKHTELNTISGLMTALTEKYIAGDCSAEGRQHLLQLMTPGAIETNMRRSCEYHVAEIDGQIAGLIAVREHRHLYQLFVAEAWHRHGVARRLWEFAMQRGLRHGNPGEFTVNSSLYAEAVYRKLGFVAVSKPMENQGVVYQPMKLVLSHRNFKEQK